MNEGEHLRESENQLKTNSGAPRVNNPLVTPAHLARTAFVYIRQSSLKQIERNVGSTELQRNQVEVAKSYGWHESFIEVVDEDLGKSARSQKRTGWRRIMNEIAEGGVGAVFIANSSRLNRVYENYAEFRKLAARHNTLIFMDNRLINLKDLMDTIYSNTNAFIAEIANLMQSEHMRRSRRAKAERGAVVSLLPVGWIRRVDGSLDFDTRVKPTLDLVFNAFRERRSLHGTVVALHREGHKLPTLRKNGNIDWLPPRLHRVKCIITNSAYSGAYIYGRTESAPELGILPNGQSARRPVPEDKWLTFRNHHPAYITEEEQQQFIKIIQSMSFAKKDRPGGGSALLQGLLECARCGRKLAVHYGPRSSHFYQCSQNSVEFGHDICFCIVGHDLDRAVIQYFFAGVEKPPLEILRKALEEAEKALEARRKQIEAERQRLEQLERLARERYHNADPKYKLVFADAQMELELAKQAVAEFRKNSLKTESAENSSLDDLQELGEIVSQVPRLWTDPEVSNHEKKALLRCAIRKIVLDVTYDEIQAIIHWESNEQLAFRLWRKRGRNKLIRELHADGLNVHEIREKLANAETSTRQGWNLTIQQIYTILKKLKLRPHTFPSKYRAGKQYAKELYESGMLPKEIAEELNKMGHRTLSGKSFTGMTAQKLLGKIPKRRAYVPELHADIFQELNMLNRTNVEIVEELNRRHIPRLRTRGPWTIEAVSLKRFYMKKCQQIK
jgi:DNA invertase Pin-like site-specific DNA recombinase